MMKRFKAFLTHPVTVSLIGLLCLSLLIWFGGPYIKFGEDNVAPLGGTTARLVAILILLVIWGLNNLRLQWQDRRQNRELVDDIQQSQQAAAPDYAGDQAQDELQQIQQRFMDALNTLKQRRFRGRANRTRALYELPWYIIVGPPGAGKTTALVNSGLDFPLSEQFGRGALQGVGGTRHCDWWFTNEAVMVDTAGRYTTQDSHRVVDSSAWDGFLGLLKKHRRRRPINGVIVSISVQDLLTQTEEERGRHARTIRARIDELMTRLEVRFPVYLMLTKADLIGGFNEFFEDLGKEEREQVWGLSLPAATRRDEAPDFSYIERELAQLENRLYDRVLWRLHQERDPGRRSAIEQFPKQVEQVNALVQAFVQQAFAANRYRYQPYLRGIYYSSGTQDGTPIDRLMSAVSSQFGFGREAVSGGYGRGKSFFLGRLFQDVIFPESELVGTNPRYERWRRWGRRGAYGALTASVVGLVAVWAGSVGRHAGHMEEVRAYLDDYQQQSAGQVGPMRVASALPPLTTLAKASDVYDREAHPWLRSVGLYDGRIDRRADSAYDNYLRGPFTRALLRDLERELNETREDLPLYNQFRVYQMFGDVDRMEKPQVKEWFTQHWRDQEALDSDQRQALARHLDRLLALDLQSRPLNESLSRRVANTLLQVPVAKRVYNRIQSDPEYQRPVDMSARYGSRVNRLFDLDAEAREASRIPWMFTREGYDEIDLSRRSPVLRELVNDRWIFASLDRSAESLSDEDLSELSDRVRALYMDDYIRVWVKAMRALDVKPFEGLNQGSDRLAQASDPLYSPLVTVLQVSAEQTRLTDPKAKEAVENTGRGRRADQATDLIASQMDVTAVDKHFRDLHRLVDEESGEAPIRSVLDEVRKLNDFVRELRSSPTPERKAFEIARERFAEGAGNPASQLQSYSRNLPQPLEQWLNDLSRETWGAVMIAARQYVDEEWRAQVYEPYERMAAGRYPLNAGADSEMSLYDFSEFFKPGGVHEQFFREYIEPFVHTRGQWSNRRVDGYGLGLSAEALGRIRQGLEVTEVMFPGGEGSPELSLEFRPRTLSKDNARFELDMGGEALSYNHGPKFWRSVEWSGSRAEQRLRLMFEGLNGGVRERTYQGPWAWLRALDDARVEKTPRSDVFHLTFAVDDADQAQDEDRIVYEVKTRSVDNVFNNNPLQQYRCPEVL